MSHPYPPTGFRQHVEVLRRRWQIWVVFALMGGLSAALRLHPHFFPSDYRAVAICLPPDFKFLKSADRNPLQYRGYGVSDNDELKRMVAWLNSDEVREVMVQTFDLIRHYDLARETDPDERQRKLELAWQDRVRVGHLWRNSVEITVYDFDSTRAAAMANHLIALADTFVARTLRRRHQLESWAEGIATLQDTLQHCHEALAQLRKQQVYNVYQAPDRLPAPMLRAFQQPGFHRQYDRMKALYARIDFLEYRIAHWMDAREFQAEQLRTWPQLVRIKSPAQVSRAVARPYRLLFTLLSMFTMGVVGMAWVLLETHATVYFRRMAAATAPPPRRNNRQDHPESPAES